MSTKNVAIIGAGAGRISTASISKQLNTPYIIFERHSDVGCIWDRSNMGILMHREAYFISAKTLSGVHGFLMPDQFHNYPCNVQEHD